MVALVRDGLGMFSVARYGAESLDAEALDRELVLGISVMKTLVARHFPIRRMLERYWNDVRALVRLR